MTLNQAGRTMGTENDPSSIVEFDINPLMLRAKGQGVVAADALVSLKAK